MYPFILYLRLIIRYLPPNIMPAWWDPCTLIYLEQRILADVSHSAMYFRQKREHEGSQFCSNHSTNNGRSNYEWLSNYWMAIFHKFRYLWLQMVSVVCHCSQLASYSCLNRQLRCYKHCHRPDIDDICLPVLRTPASNHIPQAEIRLN